MIRKTVSLVSLAALSACSLAPKYVEPALPVPPSWPVGDAYLAQNEATLPSVSYRDIFRDPRLQKVIEQALVNNRDLRAAAANIAIARAQYRIQRAELLPEIGGSAGYTRRDNGTRGVSNTANGTGTGTGNTGTGNVGTITTSGGATNTLSASLGITAFEIDLFGRVRSLTTAAQNRYFGSEATARATRLTLVGDIATAWLTYASDVSLLKIARETAALSARSVALTKLRLDGGIAPRTDLAQAQIVQQTALSDLATQTTAVAQDVNALQLLVGAPVDPALLPASIEEAAPTIAELPAGLNSSILLRRPDVVQAEYELRASNAEIGAARAALFPTISLTALAGLASSSLGNLFTGGAFNYSVAPSASYPIFRAGAGRAGVVQSRAQRDYALATYEKAIQTAFSEVADALARRGTITAQLNAQRALTAASTDNYRLSDARYRGGIDTFLQSLTAQQSLYSSQRSLVTAQLTQASNLVTLYRTLGGDSTLEVTAAGPKSTQP
ncbi:adeC/adeK/oprM family multidrug efflux complex outer membrane factor [Sphingomonas glacialis]|uniref:AdeC/adeK/oprM family multidrug efflux complex outer membrane factor n=1 Tax=Sphingomonas glacialis TaxID=658225 RepID=A0ABQ3LBC5_9SPHN|nr:efflux transporter outer membrane subunit [Sphingomonas glacialis]GHH07665.1 adeC/adeK/oprM family multidrug efflux complex outer membrane factor [Sphingomonas glacialis]